MYECPNCAGNLKFDITRQQLFCAHCETTMDPYSFRKEQDAQEYEATIFTCPQCGGEIISDDTTAATFCSFCGGATILDSRISKQRRPGYIIPFAKTKEDCKEAYAKMMSKAFFAPNELKDPGQLEKFRAIYMPYWVYSFKKNGPISFNGKTSSRSGDYVYTRHYRMDCEVEAVYDGLAFDASSSFSDNLSGAIAPFDLRKSKPFEPTFLSGFYADTNDVDDYIYETDAENIMLNNACKSIESKPVCRRYNVGQSPEKDTLRKALCPSESESKLAMLPVWFLSYRKGDRVCYAVVNGQTGKAAADLPIEPKKYLLGSLLLTIPLFFLLNLFFTFVPSKILTLALILALVSILISNIQLNRIFRRESGEDDKGLTAAGKLADSQEEKENLAQAMAAGREQKAKKRKQNQKSSLYHILQWIGIAMLIVFAFEFVPAMFTFVMIMGAFIGVPMELLFLVPIVAFIVASIVLIVYFKSKKKNGAPKLKGSYKKKLPTLAKPLIGAITALLILLINPVSDLFYYIGALVCMASVFWAFIDIIKQHNVLTTRKLPQFNKRGGDELA